MKESSLWEPPRELIHSSNISMIMESEGIKSYSDFVRRSIQDPKWFWRKLPEWLGIEWFKEPTDIVDLSKGVEWARWYRGGRVNLTYNIVDKIVKTGGSDREAFTWVGEDGSKKSLTYGELKDEVDRFSNYLREIGIGKGEVVSIYAPMLPESIIAMLSAIKIGAIASPIFSGFAPRAVADRIILGESRVLVTVDGYYRRGKIINLKRLADEAVDLSKGVVDRVIVIRRLGLDMDWFDERDEYFHNAVKGKRPSAEPEEMDPEDPALLLFTSGTTGKPKGAVISHAGSLLKPGEDQYINYDVRQGDKMWWITDIGWMMGPWQVIGSQLLGASHLMVEGAIDYPDKDRVWRLIDEYRVTQFGFAATVARMLKKLTPKIGGEYDLSSIRTFGNTGEPIDYDTWMWVMFEVGKGERPLINISGGTEVFGGLVLPSPVVPLKPTTVWGPSPGVNVDSFDDNGTSIRGAPGYLVVKNPIPSMTRGLWREPERYIETYWSRFPGVWYHGDLAVIDEDGFWYIIGRADDVIKVAGKRIGPAEIETIVNSHEAVAESACIGWPHEVKGEVIVCFVTLKEGYTKSSELEDQIADLVASSLGKPFRPHSIIFVEDLPRTRSGKIMRRVIKNIMTGRDPGNVVTLENPESIDYIKQVAKEFKELMKK
ncbi:MAG: AMP-binding protein [Desulfurococcales archaeon]|nr:AMP-binding protein [Desulfurococcales archaeon]